MTSRRWIVAERPSGLIDPERVFRLETAPMPHTTGDGQIVLRTLEVSLDPAMRGWLNEGASYRAAIPLGGVMEGAVTGVVVESTSPDYKPGDVVGAFTGWQEHAVTSAKAVFKLPAGGPSSLFLGAAGMTGLTAYFGLIDVARPKEGETILVSGAAGATGSVVGQIAKILGMRVVGTAGDDDKCAWLRSIGFDATVNYKGKSYKELAAAIKAACPGGIDVYFDNTGGDILQIALDLMNQRGRIAVCGSISSYNAEQRPPGPNNLSQLVVKRLRMEGFLVMDFNARHGEARAKLLEWIQAGKLQSRETVIEGFENLPKALTQLFVGANTGKMLVRASKL